MLAFPMSVTCAIFPANVIFFWSDYYNMWRRTQVMKLHQMNFSSVSCKLEAWNGWLGEVLTVLCCRPNYVLSLVRGLNCFHGFSQNTYLTGWSFNFWSNQIWVISLTFPEPESSLPCSQESALTLLSTQWQFNEV